MDSETDGKILLPHHVQQQLCTTRLPYRQGRKLTAVKVYTINNESKHLLVFGVPSLNLRQEAKALFAKFGRIIQFTISTDHPNEVFTETYKVVYERIQSARIAKRMLDTKNFYGGSLHVCYAPEYDSIDDIREKLKQRKRDVHLRLCNLDVERIKTNKEPEPINEMQNDEDEKLNEVNIKCSQLVSTPRDTDLYPVASMTKPCSTLAQNRLGRAEKLNMGEINFIGVGKQIRDVVLKRKLNRKRTNEKKFKGNIQDTNTSTTETKEPIDLIDCTSVEKETVTDIDVDKTLNYDSFGSEVVKELPAKPVNKIQFYIGNKS